MNDKGHFIISIIKSIIRIVGCVFAANYNSLSLLALSLVIAEVLGIFEEVVDRR